MTYLKDSADSLNFSNFFEHPKHVDSIFIFDKSNGRLLHYNGRRGMSVVGNLQDVGLIFRDLFKHSNNYSIGEVQRISFGEWEIYFKDGQEPGIVLSFIVNSSISEKQIESLHAKVEKYYQILKKDGLINPG